MLAEKAPSDLVAEVYESLRAFLFHFGRDLAVHIRRGRAGLDLTYYDRRTRDQILPVPIPQSTGFAAQRMNVGEVSNKGIEAVVNLNPIRTRWLDWDVVANFQRNRNEVVSLAPGETLPAAALAEAHGVSGSYLLKHLKALVGEGVLESVPGPHGGYRLARAPEKITLLDVVLAVEGRRPAFRCMEIRQRGPVKLPAEVYVRPCGISAAMLRAERAYRAALAETSIADIAADFATEVDPRAVEAVCAFVAHNRRPQA
jgi:Rrf2 family protein